MNILIINGSPKGKNSITLQTNVTKLRRTGSRRNAGPSSLSLFFKIMLDK